MPRCPRCGTTSERAPEASVAPAAATAPPIDTADAQITLEELIGAYLFDHHVEGFDEGSAMEAGRHILRQVVLGLVTDEHQALALAYEPVASD